MGYRDRPGCLGGLLRLFLLNEVFAWLQRRFGFGSGCSGIGCGLILLVIFGCLVLGTICNTNWLKLFGAGG